MTPAQSRTYYRSAQTNPHFILRSRAHWMTDNQWQQLDRFCAGLAVPTDPEIVLGLQHCSIAHTADRCAAWLYSTVSSIVVDEPNYSQWCQCILEHSDPDMLVDAGL